MNSKNDLVGHKVPPAHLIVRGIDKRFGGLQALKDADFEVARGEVMALVGDNGAGKSTLMKVLAGAYSADAGDFFLDGKRVSIKSPNDASALGIQIVYQDLALCENLDVAANLSLGKEPVKNGWRFLPYFLRPIDNLEMESKANRAIKRLRVRTLHSVRAKVSGLSGGQRQAIAIARAVGTESSVVMLDEPKTNSEYIYNYRDGSGIKYKGTPFNTAGWTAVEVVGQIIEKIGPILATKYNEVY